MCQISRLRCPVCHRHQNTNTNSKQKPTSSGTPTYRFRPCATIKRQATSRSPLRRNENSDHDRDDDPERNNGSSTTNHNLPSTEHVLPHGTRLHCPKLTWPLPADNLDEAEEHICDQHLHEGLRHYNWTIHERQLATLRENSYSTPSGSLPKVPIASEIKGSFPPTWDSIVSEDVLAQIITEYINPSRSRVPNHDGSTSTPETEWTPRLAEGPHRHLQLWIPCCKLCRQPSLRHGSKDRLHDNGFRDLEFEPNSMLWKWLARLPERPGVTTALSTGFMIKPCSDCIQREMVLRVEVINFLKNPSSPAECDHAKSWAIWHWLRLRCSPFEIDFWHHELPNVAVPSYDRPDWVAYLSLMADGWYSRTGVVWEDVGELEPPSMMMMGRGKGDKKGRKGTSMTTTMMMGHFGTTLVELGQWEELVKSVNPFETMKPPVLSTEQLRFLIGAVEVDTVLPKDQAASAEGMATAKDTKKQRETKRVELLTVPEAQGELGFMKAPAKELPSKYKDKIRNAEKHAKRFAIFRGVYIDPDTHKAVAKGKEPQTGRDEVLPPTFTTAKRAGSSLKGKPTSKRVRLLDDGGIHVTDSPVKSAQAMADRYKTLDTPHPSWPVPARFSEVPEDGAFVRCHCRYVHHPMGALPARASWQLPFGLREEDSE